MKFTKMQGCGNDYVYVNGFTEKLSPQEKPEIVRKLSDRHFGIGGDGVIFINPAEEADFEMEMYNADGSRSEMCGNGIRCVAKYVYDKGLTDREDITIVSAGKIKYLKLTVEGRTATDRGHVTMVQVNMGQANIQRHQGSPCFKKMGLPHFNALVVRRKDTVGLLRMVDDLTGQLCHRLRNQPGIPG